MRSDVLPEKFFADEGPRLDRRGPFLPNEVLVVENDVEK
jgi:hypothetical protein